MYKPFLFPPYVFYGQRKATAGASTSTPLRTLAGGENRDIVCITADRSDFAQEDVP
jgi:hypothetical protein